MKKILALAVCFALLPVAYSQAETPRANQPAATVGEYQNDKLSPQQLETVRTFLRMTLSRNACLSLREGLSIKRAMEKAVHNIDPILVSKHLIFHYDWLDYIGNDPNNQVTRQQFKKWTNNLDKLYECYEDFMGKKPLYNDIVFVDLHSKKFPSHHEHVEGSSGFGRAFTNSFCVNAEMWDEWNGMLSEIRTKGTPTYLVLHEMAHIFSWANGIPTKPSWVGHSEAAAQFLTSYALERGSFEYSRSRRVSGTRHRNWYLNAATKNFNSKKFKIWPDSPYDFGQVYHIYLFGLPDKVGWDTLKKAMHSYHNGTYTPVKKYEPRTSRSAIITDTADVDDDVTDADDTESARERMYALRDSNTHEFFDRIIHFHDEALELAKTDPKVQESIPIAGRRLTGEAIFWSFADKGVFYYNAFTVKTTPIHIPDMQDAP